MKSEYYAGIAGRPRFVATVAALGVVLAAAGCDIDRFLTQPVIDRVDADALNDPSQAALLVDGVQGTFECAFNAYVMFTGTLGPELQDYLAGWYAFTVIDRRAQQASGGIDGIYAWGDCTDTSLQFIGIYRPLQTARWYADEITRRLEGWTDEQVPNRTRHIATTSLYSGFAHTLLGEGFCSMAVDGGPEISPAEVFALAEDRFSKAISAAEAAGEADIVNAARIGRARVRLNLGDHAGALEDAEAVPVDFAYHADFSTAATYRSNYINLHNNQRNALTVMPSYREVTWMGVPDPRVPVFDAGLQAPGRPELWRQQKYLSATDPIAIAKWEEAQLIIAEVQGGQTAVDIINDLHARADIPPFSSEEAGEIREQVIEERRREFFLEGRRVYDMIRFGIPFLPPAGTDHPYTGGQYGTNTCLPLPDDERLNNPNIAGS